MNRIAIECPACNTGVDIEDQRVKKEEDGTQLIVTCPNCNTRFILQRVALQKLLRAKKAFLIVDGQKQEIKL